MERVQGLLSPILSASLDGESPDKEWEKTLKKLSRESEKEVENCEEQLEALAPSVRLFNERGNRAFTWRVGGAEYSERWWWQPCSRKAPGAEG